MEEKYMTVGELAKKMHTTVRTLQYYDKIGLLKTSGKSEGGRRLYKESDILKLYQIFSLKQLGFSLEDIKNKMMTLEDPGALEQLLSNQWRGIDRQIMELNVTQKAIEELREQIRNGIMPDYDQYARISVKLRDAHKNLEMWDKLEGEGREIAKSMAMKESDKADKIYREWNRISDGIAELVKANAQPSEPAAQEWITQFWDMVMDFSGGDMSVLPSLYEFGETSGQWDEELKQRQEMINDFIGEALQTYFLKNKIMPPGFGGEEDE